MKGKNTQLTLRALAILLALAWFIGLGLIISSAGRQGSNVPMAGMLLFYAGCYGGPVVAALLSKSLGVGHGCLWSVLALFVPGFALPVMAFSRLHLSAPRDRRLSENEQRGRPDHSPALPGARSCPRQRGPGPGRMEPLLVALRDADPASACRGRHHGLGATINPRSTARWSVCCTTTRPFMRRMAARPWAGPAARQPRLLSSRPRVRRRGAQARSRPWATLTTIRALRARHGPRSTTAPRSR